MPVEFLEIAADGTCPPLSVADTALPAMAPEHLSPRSWIRA